MDERKEQLMGVEVNRLEVPAKKDVKGAQFTRGVIDFDWSIGGRYAWRPSKSYLRIDLKLEKIDGGNRRPVVADNIAFCDNPCAALFENVYCRGAGADLSSIINYAGQAHQVKTRATKSRAWMESVGKTAFGINASFQDRVNQISSDGISSEENIGSAPTVLRQTIVVGGTVAVTDATGACVAAAGGAFTGAQVGDLLSVAGKTFPITVVTDATNINIAATAAGADIAATTGATVIPVNALAAGQNSDRSNIVRYHWQPAIGLFDYDGLLGSGEYRLQLSPNARFERSVVQTAADLTPGTDYAVTVEDVVFFPCIEKSNLPPSDVVPLSLSEMQVQSKPYGTSAGSGVLDFTVPPSTQQIAVWVQSNSSGSDTRTGAVHMVL
jgi:hypothetical protein